MLKKYSLPLKIFAGTLVASFLILLFFQKKSKSPNRVLWGEEVYASHDCTDCHLDAEKLREKKLKNEVGLLRMRRDITVIQEFLEHDPRHNSYLLMTGEDRTNLIEYLKSFTP